MLSAGYGRKWGARHKSETDYAYVQQLRRLGVTLMHGRSTDNGNG
jgi:hypothetical protein